METHYARALAEFILLVSSARMIFTLKRYSFYKYSYVFMLYGLSLICSALGVFRYVNTVDLMSILVGFAMLITKKISVFRPIGNPVYGPKIKMVYEAFKKLYTNIGLPFFVVEFYFYQVYLKCNSSDGTNNFLENLLKEDGENQKVSSQELIKLIIPNALAPYSSNVFLFRFIGVLIFHTLLFYVISVILTTFRFFRYIGASALLTIGYIFSIFWFSVSNVTGFLNLWGLAVMISAFIDKFILSQQSELGWRLGIPVLLDELRILNLVFFTVFTAKALTD